VTIKGLKAEKLADLRIKHLEMLQGLIARVSGQGATLKNYCITLTVAVCGFGFTTEKALVVLLALGPVTIFALLDAQYLRIERRFRGLFNKVRAGNWATAPNFDLNVEAAPAEPYLGVLFSWSITVFYIPLGIAVAVLAEIARCIYGTWL
jgi:hypothetical protein